MLLEERVWKIERTHAVGLWLEVSVTRSLAEMRLGLAVQETEGRWQKDRERTQGSGKKILVEHSRKNLRWCWTGYWDWATGSPRARRRWKKSVPVVVWLGGFRCPGCQGWR